MEGLISSRIIPIRGYSSQGNTALFPTHTLNRRRVFYGPIKMMAPTNSSNSKVGSVKPISASSLGRLDNTLPSKEVLDLWQKADAFCFDVDSTVCVDEGIDELAEFCGAGKAVAEWTARAMGGSVPFEEALAARLDLFKPSLSTVQDFLEKRPPRYAAVSNTFATVGFSFFVCLLLVVLIFFSFWIGRLSPGIMELVQKLKESGKTVYLISGGFRQMINVHGYKTVVVIGDGATDLEARRPGCADLFICYGGVQLREAVSAKVDWLVYNFKDLINSLE